MAVLVATLVFAACGGDDDDTPESGVGASEAAGDSGSAATDGGENDDDSGTSDDGLTGADGEALPELQGGDGDLADFPIPSPPGALEGIVAEIDGMSVATAVYPADRYDEIVDHYENWFIDNGLIATAPDRSAGIIAIGGVNDSGEYFASIITDGDVLQIQLTAP